MEGAAIAKELSKVHILVKIGTYAEIGKQIAWMEISYPGLFVWFNYRFLLKISLTVKLGANDTSTKMFYYLLGSSTRNLLSISSTIGMIYLSIANYFWKFHFTNTRDATKNKNRFKFLKYHENLISSIVKFIFVHQIHNENSVNIITQATNWFKNKEQIHKRS